MNRKDEIRKQAEAEKYAPMGEKSKPKPNWEDIEAEIQESLTN